ncbi:MAG: carbon starvation protein A [Planctomycetia bacterium]|nr:carbon starvation protein A [Planctomycetia bacterium]
MNSLWLVITALAAFLVAYRFYGAFLAAKVAVLDDRNPTPAHRLRDGVDYHPTKKLVLFGHHFAAIAGPGPLIGPVLASQWGYFPGFAWIVIGACLAGGVHDFVVLVASVRQDGQTLPKIARNTIGPVAGATTAIATLFIVVAVLASVAIVVVNALSHSSWGMFTILVTIPAALLTGAWMYKIRPGKVGEASVIGVTIVMLGVILGKPFADSFLGQYLVLDPKVLTIMLPTYAAIASILPVWVLMCPRDYLSSYMKIGVIIVLAVGIFVAQPELKMPATTPFLAGGGPVVSGAVWPFVCIVIMCGALSGFHALIASGTTPKMINKESDIRPIGYGAMILEGFVALTALVAACALEPGDYFRINTPESTPAEVARYDAMVVDAKLQHNWDLTPKELPALEKGVQESLVGRTGGAVTLAVGMAKVFSSLPLMKDLMAYWYHFVIMFEALFILTLLETGTRVARFVFQETLAQFNPRYQLGHHPNWALNVTMSIVVCSLWGGLLYIGNLDTLWRMLGIANQLLATIALAVGTTYLLLHAPKRVYALCTGIPFVFAFVTTFTAGVESIQMWWRKPETDPTQIFLSKLACVLAAIMLSLTVIIALDTLRRWYVLLANGAKQPDAEPEEVAEEEQA